ncbi:AI-2E family transporter [cf. Phormidesmis sp. LEGE 11477]|uniref:AI-2E family transporter n=1 Tax=cf. Phormidesmis sp. LEGE 11477 TaxID=1828680 RepID=UPI00187F8CC8|nr:AI-2E family transporter [cf. Phormidesmis sp. LEGE 11477]MBE9062361.1 AI-2E family transporter [cf. Phormidesmis sp. LEGE 11477]
MKLGDWISLLCLIAAGYILWQIRPLLLLSFAAVVIAIALNSITQKIKTTLKIRRRAAIPITLAIAAIVALVFIIGIVPPFIEQFRLLAVLLVRFSQTLPARILDLQANMPERIRLPELNEFLAWLTAPDSAAIDVFGNFFSIFNSSLQILLQTLFVSVLSLMILANPDAYLQVILLIFPAFYRQRAEEIFYKCELVLGNWLGGILISSIFVFSISFIGLLVLQIDLAFAHALIAGILNFIPNLGPTISMVFPVIVALISNDPWKVVAVIGLYIIVQQIESYWLTPTIMAHQVSLLPAFTLIAQIFFASVFGVLGLLLALPLTVVVKTWIHEVLIIDVLNNWQLAPPVLRSKTTHTAQSPNALKSRSTGML